MVMQPRGPNSLTRYFDNSSQGLVSWIPEMLLFSTQTSR